MFHSRLLSCIATLSVTHFFHRSVHGTNFVGRHPQQEKRSNMRPGHVVSEYMWDVYHKGVNSSEFDVVRGIYPKTTGFSFNSRIHRNHRKRQVEFTVPEPQRDERLVKAEVRLTTDREKHLETSLQIYLRADRWLFLGEKKVSDVELTYISFHVTPITHVTPGVVTFLVLSRCRGCDKRRDRDFLRPALLLFYLSDRPFAERYRTKRSPQLEDYEEETNRIWEAELFSRGPPEGLPKRAKSGCKRKPLYIKFSEIDFDSWVVAPSGYEAFQCAGKCTFPVGEHLSPTKHAILQTLVHDVAPWKAPRACCVPTRLDPISILYVDDGGVLTYRFSYRDMVVAECGCR